MNFLEEWIYLFNKSLETPFKITRKNNDFPLEKCFEYLFGILNSDTLDTSYYKDNKGRISLFLDPEYNFEIFFNNDLKNTAEPYIQIYLFKDKNPEIMPLRFYQEEMMLQVVTHMEGYPKLSGHEKIKYMKSIENYLETQTKKETENVP